MKRMNMNKGKKRAAVCFLLGCMLLAFSGSVMAADTATTSTAAPSFSPGQNGPGQQGGPGDQTTMLSQLVQEGIITQEEMDKIVTYMDEQRAAMPNDTGSTGNTSTPPAQQMQPGQGNQHDMWSDLVTAGIITQAQADAIKAKMPQPQNSGQANAASSVGVEIDDQLLTLNPGAQIVNERTLAPLRGIFEALGLTVNWDAATQTVTGTKDGTTITIPINSNTATVNGTTVSLDVPAQIINNSTFVPVRFIADSLGVTVNWDSENRIVEITTK